MSACRKISQLRYYRSFYLPVRHYNHEIRSHQFDSPDVYCCNLFSFVELCRLKLQFYVLKSRGINFIYFVIPLPLPKSCWKISPLCECTSVCIVFLDWHQSIKMYIITFIIIYNYIKSSYTNSNFSDSQIF